MVTQVIHNATITLQLPFDISPTAEVAALRAAGIPVDGLGNATERTRFGGLPQASAESRSI
jgi:hypothetical protein